jgi:large subunit ribosomal protein L5
MRVHSKALWALSLGRESRAKEKNKMAETNGSSAAPTPRLKERYQREIVPALMKEFGYKNIMQAPKLEKVVINMGVGQAGQTGGDPKLLDNAIRDLTTITGQKPAVTRAKKSIATSSCAPERASGRR